jgi:hypothetical protein
MLLTGQALSASAQDDVLGKWSPKMDWPNVAIHTHVLPSGKVLFWGRREWKPNGTPKENLDVHVCTPRLWDPSTGMFIETANKPGFNLFCSGHTFLADGKLLVVGGHLYDGEGEKRATVYDPATNQWTETLPTNAGRWYPTLVTLPDGGVLVTSGQPKPSEPNNPVQQVWKNGTWREIVRFDGLPFYPRMHVMSDGRVFMAGSLALTQIVSTAEHTSNWEFLKPGDLGGSSRKNGQREYAPSVLYDQDKVIFIGGRNVPIAKAEIVDLANRAAGWSETDPMHFARVQHNATLLPDGTVLVTGGTKGDKGKPEAHGHNDGFNDLRIGQPIRAAEVWNPATKHWTLLAEEAVDRCYHSTAVLLPDATVLSAGGGEYKPDDVNQNSFEDSQRNAQIFSPPYLFKGARPIISSAPAEVAYGAAFDVGTPIPANIAKASWVRLSSVTHAFNSNQRINFFSVTPGIMKVTLTAPASANVCPPGHYMLFLLNAAGVPSVARIIRIH